VILFCGTAFGTILIAFFLSSSRITKYKYKSKVKRLHQTSLRGGSRNWSHVLSSSVTALLVVLLYYLTYGVHTKFFLGKTHSYRTSLMSAYISHYACCTGDTWASELGALEQAMPVLITKCRRVPQGTNGAMSLTGTVASILGTNDIIYRLQHKL